MSAIKDSVLCCAVAIQEEARARAEAQAKAQEEQRRRQEEQRRKQEQARAAAADAARKKQVRAQTPIPSGRVALCHSVMSRLVADCQPRLNCALLRYALNNIYALSVIIHYAMSAYCSRSTAWC